MASAFIWYHGQLKDAAIYQAWLQTALEKTGVTGRLLVRQQIEKTTFMEVYEHIDVAIIDKLVRLAEQQA